MEQQARPHGQATWASNIEDRQRDVESSGLDRVGGAGFGVALAMREEKSLGTDTVGRPPSLTRDGTAVAPAQQFNNR
jgi:hypothetical protein